MATGIIKAARRRLNLIACLEFAAPLSVVVAAVACAGAVIDRLPGGPFLDWVWVAPVLVGFVVLAVAFRWVGSRVSMHDAAVVLDERLGQHEAFSTAMLVAHRGDEAVPSLIVARAESLAGAPDIRRRMVGALAVPGSNMWLVTLGLVAATAGLSMLGQLPGGSTSSPLVAMDVEEARMDTDEAMASVRDALRDAPDLESALGEGLFGEVEDRDARTLRRETVRQLSSLAGRLEDIQSEAQNSGALDAVEALRSIPQVDDDDATAEVREAMASGDMDAVVEALERMNSAEGAGVDDAEARKALAQDILDAAEADQSLASNLKRAGMDPALQEDPEALQQAIDRNTRLSEQQKQDLKQAASRCAGCRQQLTDMARQVQQGDRPGQSAAAREMADQQRLSRQASACRNACTTACRKAGARMGAASPAPMPTRGPGGAGMPVTDDETSIGEDTLAGGAIDGEAEVIESSKVRVPLPAGEAHQGVASPMVAAQRRLEDGVDTRAVARRYREAVRAWFAGAVVDDGDAPSEGEGASSGDDGGSSGGEAQGTSSGGGGDAGTSGS